MITLKALSQAAMLGPGSGFTLPVLEQFHLAAAEPETALLAAAALVGAAEMGGAMPVHLENRAAACPGETRPYMPEQAASLLKWILEGEHKWLLGEFLQQAAERGLLVPPELLPTLLGLGINGRHTPGLEINGRHTPGLEINGRHTPGLEINGLHTLVVQAGGQRGRWLAEQNPAWNYARGQDPQDAWEHGASFERLGALEALRAARPAQARAWLQAAWEQDAPADRAAFLGALAIGLGMDDEPFLESCLDDKRKEVRQAAGRLLLRLEQSRLCWRAWERVKPLVKLKSKFLGGDKLLVTLPEALDGAAKRDGAGGLPVRKKMGEKAALLAQLLSLAPPGRWSRELGRPPEKLLAAAANCEWKEPLILGWLLAAQNTGDCQWAEALVSFWLGHEAGPQILEAGSLDELILLMRAEKVEALACEAIKPPGKGLDENSLLLAVLEKYRRPWSPGMARAVIRSAQKQAVHFCHRLPLALPGFARWVPAELAAELSAGWPARPAGCWGKPIEQFLTTLYFRSEIRQSMA